MTKDLAEGILALDFPEADVLRGDDLNAKANDGTLTEDDQVELEAYVSIADMLASGSRGLVGSCRSFNRRLGACYATKDIFGRP
jgi:hypothetical protein